MGIPETTAEYPSTFDYRLCVRKGWFTEHDGTYSKDGLHLNMRGAAALWKGFLENAGGWHWETVFKLGGKGGAY